MVSLIVLKTIFVRNVRTKTHFTIFMHKIPYLPDTNRYKRKGKKQEFRDQITQVDSMEDINWIFFLVCLHFIQFKTQEVRFRPWNCVSLFRPTCWHYQKRPRLFPMINEIQYNRLRESLLCSTNVEIIPFVCYIF